MGVTLPTFCSCRDANSSKRIIKQYNLIITANVALKLKTSDTFQKLLFFIIHLKDETCRSHQVW